MTQPNSSLCSLRNLRDLGGLPCAEDRHIRPGKLYRSQLLTRLRPADRAFLDSLHLDAVLDFRTREEVNQKKDELLAGCKYFNLPVYSELDFPHLPVLKIARRKTLLLRGESVEEPMEEKRRCYRQMPFAVDALSKIFSLMDEGKTFLFHCTAGKDRTGIAAMLIEFALGRSYETILEEYLRSDLLNPPHRRRALRLFGCSQQLIDNIFYCEGVHKELLDLSLHAILEKYPSVEEFLLKEYAVTPERRARWQDQYLD